MKTEPTTPTGNQATGLAELCLAIAGHSPLPMAAVEGAGHILRYANPAFCRLMDKTGEELTGESFCELLPGQEECVRLFDRVFCTGTPESHTQQENSKPNSVFWAYTLWPVRTYAGGAGVMIQVTETARFHNAALAMNEALMVGSVRQHELREISEDLNAQLHVEIIERKQVEAALREAQTELADRAGQLEHIVAGRTAELRSTNEQLEAFVYSIAHDLRAPLRAMQGNAEMLVETEGAALSETGRNHANRINRAAQQMDALLLDLLVFSRTSQQRIELAAVDLAVVVQSVVSNLEKEIQEKHARIELAGLWPVVRAHEATLGQIMVNLVGNALKFVAPGTAPLIRLRAEELDGFIRVWVEDNGVGIEPRHQEEIFGLFKRLHGGQFAGTGVGLAIVRKGLERMGGRVGVESSVGRGSRFWLELRKA